MTTATANFAFRTDTAANARTWLDGVKNLITTAGLVQTSDTGQLDSSTVTSNPGTNVNFGYQVFKFPDAQQSAMPVFIRLQYQVNSGYPFIQYTVGASTDGAGSIADPIISGQSGNSGGTSAVNSYACYVGGTFSMVMGYGIFDQGNQNNCVINLTIDRARDSSGNALASGYLAEGTTGSYGSQMVSRSWYGPGSPNGNFNFVPSLIPSTTALSTSEGANVNVFRHYSMVPGVRPQLGMLTYLYSEFGALTPFTATVLGAQHTYLPMGYAMNYFSAVPKVTHCAAIRWE